MEKKSPNHDSIEQRLKHLEDKYNVAQKYFESSMSTIKWIVTVVFIGVGIVVGFFSFTSRQEVMEATRKMEADVKDSLKEYDRKFEILSGQALQKPELEISYDGKTITNKTITLYYDMIQTSKTLKIPLHKLNLKNIGKKIADEISINFYLPKEPKEISQFSYSWDKRKSVADNYPTLLKYKKYLSLNPTETWNYPDIFEVHFDDYTISEFSAKMEIYYGVDKPVGVKILFKRKK